MIHLGGVLSPAAQSAQSVDCVVLGAGIAGLLSAQRLASVGYKVLVVDPSDQVMSGASSRNEGWVHAGTYHALSIRDRSQALQVARRCLAGWRTYTTEFKGCLEPEERSAIAIVRENVTEDALERWESAGVAYREAPAAMRSALEEVSLRNDERIFLVADRSINMAMLAAQLHRQVRALGGQFLLGASPTALADGALTVMRPDGEQIVVEHDVLVMATGYSSTTVAEQLGLRALPTRLWQSHLAILPRLTAASVFSVHPKEAAAANHGGWSIVGLNEDARLVDEPTFEPSAEGSAHLLAAIEQRFPNADFSRAHVISCVKVDVRRELDPARSLNISLDWLDDRVISLLPGKMTEAPWAVDALVHEIFNHLTNSAVTARPLDVHRTSLGLAGTPRSGS